MSGGYRYAETTLHDGLNFEVYHAAHTAKNDALLAMGVDPNVITLRFYRPANYTERDISFVVPGEAKGLYGVGGSEIWILAGNDPTDAAVSAAHEARHVWQHLSGSMQRDSVGQEEDAESWALGFVDSRRREC